MTNVLFIVALQASISTFNSNWHCSKSFYETVYFFLLDIYGLLLYNTVSATFVMVFKVGEMLC